MIRIALLLLALAAPLAAQPVQPQPLMPFHEVVKIVAQRFDGRLLAARIDQPRPYEFALGAEVVQQLTLLSPQGNILLIRLDGVTEGLELKALPGVFAAGEMLDWEAPTGGYLLTHCLGSGQWAGRAAADYLRASARR